MASVNSASMSQRRKCRAQPRLTRPLRCWSTRRQSLRSASKPLPGNRTTHRRPVALGFSSPVSASGASRRAVTYHQPVAREISPPGSPPIRAPELPRSPVMGRQRHSKAARCMSRLHHLPPLPPRTRQTKQRLLLQSSQLRMRQLRSTPASRPRQRRPPVGLAGDAVGAHRVRRLTARRPPRSHRPSSTGQSPVRMTLTPRLRPKLPSTVRFVVDAGAGAHAPRLSPSAIACKLVPVRPAEPRSFRARCLREPD